MSYQRGVSSNRLMTFLRTPPTMAATMADSVEMGISNDSRDEEFGFVQTSSPGLGQWSWWRWDYLFDWGLIILIALVELSFTQFVFEPYDRFLPKDDPSLSYPLLPDTVCRPFHLHLHFFLFIRQHPFADRPCMHRCPRGAWRSSTPSGRWCSSVSFSCSSCAARTTSTTRASVSRSPSSSLSSSPTASRWLPAATDLTGEG